MPNRLQKAKHLIIAFILTLVVAAALMLALQYVRLLPVSASVQAQPIDQLFRLEFMIIAFLFALIVVFMIYSIVVFRRKDGDTSDAQHITGNTKLEIAWTIAPLVTVLALAYLGGNALAATLTPEPRPLRIEVIGKQWSWSFVYPESGVVSDKLYMPVNKQALLELSSQDVIHSFWVPEFRVKQDALPGGKAFVRDLRVTPDKIGEYQLLCAELCGERHAYMTAPVIVLSQADFDAWLQKESGLANDPVARGEKFSRQYGCLGCHSLDGSKSVGPTWKGLAGSKVTLNDGTTVVADQTYLAESITNPAAKLVQGFPPIMPAKFIDPGTGQPISAAQIADMIAFLQTLK
jgi:cytochrome c oxidase subunit II